VVSDGYKFAAAPIILGVLSLIFGWRITPLVVLGIVFLLLGAFVSWFFRDPERTVPADPSAVVAPADGRVLEIVPEHLADRPGQRMSIFLAIWNVHVNRAPVAGRISDVQYRPGRFHMAMRSEASAQNEQNVIHLETPRGEIVFKQIAGWVARRVILWKKPGETVGRGERVGIVRFGSRVDLWLPPEAQIVVKPGDHVAGGSSIVARWPS